ncbi:MAG: Uma2 family endonuclease [Vulcanimicrobiaceae bacterium]
MSALPHEPLSKDEFLAWELAQEEKHEFVDGYVYPLFGDRTAQGFAGGTGRHAQLATELTALIVPAARPCRTYGSDMRIETITGIRYADIFVTCDERDRNDALVMRYPKLIVEVLSESTAREDLGSKMREYTTIETLEEYLMIDSRKRWTQIMRRDQGLWNLLPPGAAGTLELLSIALRVDCDLLYERVEIP